MASIRRDIERAFCWAPLVSDVPCPPLTRLRPLGVTPSLGPTRRVILPRIESRFQLIDFRALLWFECQPRRLRFKVSRCSRWELRREEVKKRKNSISLASRDLRSEGGSRRFESLSLGGLAKGNRLSRKDNQRLADSQDIHEIISLLVKGLDACAVPEVRPER